MNRNLSTTTVFLTLLILCISISSSIAGELTAVCGRVTDSDNRPIFGVTVLILSGEKVLTGVSSDTDGHYLLKIKSSNESLNLQISAVGFVSQTIKIDLSQKNIEHNVKLEPKAVELSTIAASRSLLHGLVTRAKIILIARA